MKEILGKRKIGEKERKIGGEKEKEKIVKKILEERK